MDGQEVHSYQKEAAIDQTIKYPFVVQNIDLNARNLVDWVMPGRIPGKEEIKPKIVKALTEYAKERAQKALRNPVESPDFSDDDWQQKFADVCEESALRGETPGSISKQLMKRTNPLFPQKYITSTPPDILISGYILTAMRIMNCVSQVSAMIYQGNDPELLKLTDKQAQDELSRLAKEQEEAGGDVAYYVGRKKKK